MLQFEDIPGALTAIAAIMMAADQMTAASELPEDARAALAASMAAVSAVDRIVLFGRGVHTHRAVLNAEARAIGAAALGFAAQNGWHGLDSEAPAMIAALLAAD